MRISEILDIKEIQIKKKNLKNKNSQKKLIDYKKQKI